MSKKKVMVTTIISYETFHEEDFKAPSNLYFVNALGDYIFLNTRDKALAVQYIKEEYDGKYSVRVYGNEKGSGTNTVRCSVSNKSRAGAFLESIRARQGRGCD